MDDATLARHQGVCSFEILGIFLVPKRPEGMRGRDANCFAEQSGMHSQPEVGNQKSITDLFLNKRKPLKRLNIKTL